MVLKFKTRQSSSLRYTETLRNHLLPEVTSVDAHLCPEKQEGNSEFEGWFHKDKGGGYNIGFYCNCFFFFITE